MNQISFITSQNAVVYSSSMHSRNYLREQLARSGYNAVCFGDDAICIDNIEPIQPQIIMAETDSADVIWRFIFSIYASGDQTPLVIVSDRIGVKQFETIEYNLPLSITTLDETRTHLLEKRYHCAPNKTRTLPLLVGQTKAILEIRSLLPILAGTPDAVFITGERGTGKELLIRLIVGLSDGLDRFIKIDCRQLLPKMLISAVIKKTFVNGDSDKPTTIFLDNLDELTMELQAEMLLVLDAQQRQADAANSDKSSSIRFLCASSRPLDPIVQQEKFRKDLYYRLNVINLALPALRERREDISLLMDYFVIEACAKMEKCITFPSNQARQTCYMHSWPGNIAELQNQMYRFAKTGSEASIYSNNNIPKINEKAMRYLPNLIEIEDLPKIYEIKDQLPDMQSMSLKSFCDQFVSRTEKRLMKRALESTNWNRKKAAKILKISYKSMLNKMKAYDII